MTAPENVDGAENSSQDNPDDPYAGEKNGEPLVCSECGEYVVVQYRPQGEYPARTAGFSAECACAAGPEIKPETLIHFWPPWFVDIVVEAEDDPESWLNCYTHESMDAAELIEEYAEGGDESAA